jgi:D-sedoheptulose 7-phosphate isomerase
MNDKIEKIVRESIRVKEVLLKSETVNIEKAAAAIAKSIKSGGKVLIFGNGGSAADSQHMAAELVGRFKKERKAFPAIALTTDTSTLTALANDYGYDHVFSRQIEALGKPGDIAFGISTSGNSNNVIEAIKKGKSLGLTTIGLTGHDGGKLKKECDITIIVPSKDTPRIQESHTMIIHIICELVENEF